MTEIQISRDIERGIEIRAEMERLKEELKEIEARLQRVGEQGPHEPLKNEDREGKQFIARSARHILPVVFESDMLMASFKPDSPTHKEIAVILGDKLPTFFRDIRIFERVHKEDGEKFRRLARTTLEPDVFAKLIRAATARQKGGIAKSRVVVSWKEAQEIAAQSQA